MSIFSQFQKTLSLKALEQDVLEKYPTNQKNEVFFFYLWGIFQVHFFQALERRVFFEIVKI